MSKLNLAPSLRKLGFLTIFVAKKQQILFLWLKTHIFSCGLALAFGILAPS